MWKRRTPNDEALSGMLGLERNGEVTDDDVAHRTVNRMPASMLPKLSKGEIAVLSFTALYMAVSLVAMFLVRNSEFVFYFVVMCCLIAAVASVHLRVRFNKWALWGLSVWGLAHMAGGLMPIPSSWPINGESYVLYNWWIVPKLLKYDQIVHAFGFGLVTWVCWQALRASFSNRGILVEPTFGLLTLCVAAGTGFGATNEVVEFVATLTLPGTNVGGYANTGWDLVSNFIGAVAAAVLIQICSGPTR